MKSPTGYDDVDAQTDTDIFCEAKEFLQTVIDAESDNRSRALAALNFRDGTQWPEPLLLNRSDRLNIVVNHTDTLVTRIENNLKQQRPRIKCHPVGDGADIEKAKLVNGLTRHIESVSQASVAYDCGGSSALSVGWGYWRIVADYISPTSFDQDLFIRPIRNVFTVYKDPASILPDGSDSMRYIISEKMKRTQYRQMYPDATNVDWGDTGVGDDLEWESRDEIRLAEYYRIIQKPEKLYKMVDGSTMFESDFAPGVLKTALKDPEQHGFAMEGGSPVERKTFKRQVQWFRINGREVVDRRDLPGRYIPVILCTGNVLDINGKVRRKGMIDNMIEPARLCNYWESSKAERLALAPKAPWVAYEGVIDGHNEWHDANQKAYSVLVGKAIQGPNGETLPLPRREPPIAADVGLAEASQDAEHLLIAVAGMPHEPGQDRKSEVVSGVAIQKRQNLSDDSHYQYYDNQTLSIAFTGRVLLDLIPYYYDTPRQQRIIGDDGLPQMVELNQQQKDPETGAITVKNDMSVGEYDVVMDTGPGYDPKRQEGAVAMVGLMGTPMGEVITKAAPDVVMRAMDFPYADEIADRLLPTNPAGLQKAMQELPKQAQAIVSALQQQLQKTTQELQHAQLELKYKTATELGWMHVEREKAHLQAETKTRDTHTMAQVKVHDTLLRGDTARDVAEIQAGATLLNSHVEAEHNKAAADRMIEQAAASETKN